MRAKGHKELLHGELRSGCRECHTQPLLVSSSPWVAPVFPDAEKLSLRPAEIDRPQPFPQTMSTLLPGCLRAEQLACTGGISYA